MSLTETYHVPVLAAAVVEQLQIVPEGIYVDGTTGGGGHAEAILERLEGAGRLIAMDQDAEAIQAAQSRLARFGGRVSLQRSRFQDMAQVLEDLGVSCVDGVVLDLGVSSHQIDTPVRGFSYRAGGPLDMRMDRSGGRTAAELVNTASREDLQQIFRRYGEERRAAGVARAVLRARRERPFQTTDQLARVVTSVVPPPHQVKSLARIFQALRIVVNDELKALEQGLQAGFSHLKKGGRMVVISYHSLEDRLVKRFFKTLARGCICPPELPCCVCHRTAALVLPGKQPIYPSADELRANRRARSARLRVAEKIER